MRKGGNRLRITAQLINAADGFHLWSERYDRELTDIFAVQDEISASIAAVLKVKLAAGPESGARHVPKVAAYEAFLKARHFEWTNHSPESLEKSRECYEQAAALDPNTRCRTWGWRNTITSLALPKMNPREGVALGREAAQRALRLDASLPEAHAWLGIFAVWADFNWNEARTEVDLALARRPVSGYVRHLYGYFYLRKVGRALESVDQHRRAVEEDPLNLIVRVGLSASLTAAGKDEEAAAEVRKILEDRAQLCARLRLTGFERYQGAAFGSAGICRKGERAGALVSDQHRPAGRIAVQERRPFKVRGTVGSVGRRARQWSAGGVRHLLSSLRRDRTGGRMDGKGARAEACYGGHAAVRATLETAIAPFPQWLRNSPGA